MKFTDKRIKFIVGAVLIITVAYWGYDQWREVGAAKEVKQMTEKMVTYCVGRYLIDLPKDTEVNYGATRVDGVDIAFLEIDAKQPLFSERVKAREIELKEQKNRQGKVSLEQVDEFNPPSLSGKMFIYGRKQTTLTGDDDKPYIVENVAAQAWLRGPGVEYLLEAGTIDPDRIPNISRLARQLRPTPSNKIPTEPGFCIERGIILDPPGLDQNESIVLHFRLKKNPDVMGNLSIGVNGGDKLEETLLERDAKNDITQKYSSHFKSIFKGDRAINGIPGQEVSEKVRENNGTRAHSFMWDTVGKLNDVLAPSITLDIATGYGPPGKPLNSSLPDKAANDLWKIISGSIRLRPTGPAKISAAEPTPSEDSSAAKRLPIGTKVSSNSHCPQTGIWQCAADAPGITQHRQFITAGKPMPYGVTQQTANGVSGFFGRREDVTVDVAWSLIAYEKGST